MIKQDTYKSLVRPDKAVSQYLVKGNGDPTHVASPPVMHPVEDREASPSHGGVNLKH